MKNTQPARVSRQQRRPGFSLVELLVTITVIGVLAALLFPAIGVIREKGNRTRCMNNLRQITQAGILFSTEHGGNLPYKFTWAYSNTASEYDGGELWEYLGKTNILVCPCDKEMRTRLCDAGRLSSYVINALSNSTSRYSMRRVKANDVYFFEVEDKVICKRNDLAKLPVESGSPRSLTDRHLRGGNISCYDGHVEWMDIERWVQLARIGAGEKNRLWPLGYAE